MPLRPTGVFAPPALVGPVPFADLRAMIARAETALEAFTPDEVAFMTEPYADAAKLRLAMFPATAYRDSLLAVADYTVQRAR